MSSGGKTSGGNGAGGSDADGSGGQVPVETVPLTLQFRAQVGEQPFACGKTYSKQGSTEVEVTPAFLRAYVSNVRLITEQGDEVPLTIREVSPWQGGGVALLDFEDGSGACKNGNPDLRGEIEGEVPRGDYVGVVFSTSVPESMNHEDPTTLPAPLQVSGMYWSWIMGYVFLKAEMVQVDSSERESAGAGILHLGSLGCTRSAEAGVAGGAGEEGDIECAAENYNEIRLMDFAAEDDAIVIDVATLMKEVDLRAANLCHPTGPTCAPLYSSLGLDYETGERTEAQTAFRVESQ
jgi:uncharacterized repeat protein (TIGR04052 family)